MTKRYIFKCNQPTGHEDGIIGELLAANAQLKKLTEAIKRVRELHKPVDTSKIWGMPDYGICCVACEVNGMAVEYPCPTIKALDGDKS